MQTTPKTLACTLAFLISVGLTACGSKETKTDTTETATEATTDAAENTKPADKATEKAEKAEKAEIKDKNEKKADDQANYNGTINGNLKIQLKLEYKGTEAGPNGMNRDAYEGWYYYESQGKEKKIALEGEFFSGQLFLNEMVDGKITGTFTLNSSDDGFTGEWQAPNSTKAMKVVLKEKS
ncbi:hypothetical protein [Eisenibacter elegans]|uniref:hypothetical protein n=1 Tax=Eisenibacter elegans TaxID=997 RepID=UPI0004018D32|nr:hypothetical protein [Eisenibacter elegans]